jgi:molybdopterin/thiamine biosynthesis adenylyltransferase
MNSQLAYSRPQKSVAGLGKLARDPHRFLEKQVLLTGDAPHLATVNGRNTFLYSIRLLVRICPNLTIMLPAESGFLRSEAEQISARIAFGKAVQFAEAELDIRSFDAILSVGNVVHPSLPWTAINSNGWVCRVSSGKTPLATQSEMENPVGALAAACLGTGEVFKRLIALDPNRGELLDGFAFSLRTFEISPQDSGPALPAAIEVDLLVVGAGAIGNGIVALLVDLPWCGSISIVDRERYGDENLGTCILIGPDDITVPKAEVLEQCLLSAGKSAKGFDSTFASYAAALGDRYPVLVLNGLDNIDVRHEVQRSLWPDLIVDGAIGDFVCQVSRHPWGEDAACLMCLFREPTRSSELDAIEATGLSHARIGQPDSVVTSDDVAAAPNHMKEYLETHLGKRVCSVVSAAVTQKISREEQARGFEPSVPFVAVFSACMVVAEAIAKVTGWPSVLSSRFQFDFLQGPGRGQMYPQARRGDCLCARTRNIERVRGSHGLGGSSLLVTARSFSAQQS